MSEQSERIIRDFLFDSLHKLIGDGAASHSKTHFALKENFGKGHCEVEGKMQYCLPSGRCLSHACDILVTLPGKKYLGIEIKFRSAVSDQFKCRSFDIMNIKKNLGGNFFAVMVYAHAPGGGIGLDLARDYCHPYDLFIGREVSSLEDLKELENIAAEIRDCLVAYTGRKSAAAAK